ncbi:uncharacterized protein [Zea mays]|uniref:uncharacterized protein isoform X1 n=1 Tax=Zea mays TaxID=4577 RepID=UPI0004DEB481|nr:uncharacterized protein LOC100277216 isoform X1 [Zea mays]XP_008670433.1 uncharacterized protein LOC100277216 isoform X1 [Zea mays]|eukprot:XP_008670432.1 uncharacterized protein LOC100277216 [Zea mays]
MAPLYAISSFVGLLDIQGSKTFFTFLDAVKECYEALVIAKFMALMYSYLNISISKNIVPDEIKGGKGGGVLHHSFHVSVFLNTPTYCTALHIFVPGFRARYLSWSRRDQIPPFLAGRGAHPGGHPERAGDPRDGRVFRRPLYGLVRFYPNPYGLRGFQSLRR